MEFSVFWISWIEAREKGKESFNDVTVVLGIMNLRSSKHPRRGSDLHVAHFIPFLAFAWNSGQLCYKSVSIHLLDGEEA